MVKIMRLLSFFVFVIAVLGVGAQDTPPPNPKPKPEKKETPPKKPEERKMAATLLVTPDEACVLFVDGEKVATLKQYEARKVPVGQGEHLVRAVSMDEKAVVNKRINVQKAGQTVVPVEMRAAMENAEAAKRFVDNRDGTVTDTKTGLMWASKDNGSDINWTDAKKYCESYNGGGHTDWRMPTLEELSGLYDERYTQSVYCAKRSWNDHVTPLIKLSCFSVWSSELQARERAHGFYFYEFHDFLHDVSDSFATRALPVRSAK